MRSAAQWRRMCSCVAALIASVVLTGCAAARFDSVVGQPKERLLAVAGPPTQIIQSRDQSEIWVYPTSRIVDTGLPLEDDDTIGDALQKGIAEGLAESIMDTVFLPGGPYRYVVISPDGRVQSWEMRALVE